MEDELEQRVQEIVERLFVGATIEVEATTEQEMRRIVRQEVGILLAHLIAQLPPMAYSARKMIEEAVAAWDSGRLLR